MTLTERIIAQNPTLVKPRFADKIIGAKHLNGCGRQRQ